jgi:hypothetical protein
MAIKEANQRLQLSEVRAFCVGDERVAVVEGVPVVEKIE